MGRNVETIHDVVRLLRDSVIRRFRNLADVSEIVEYLTEEQCIDLANTWAYRARDSQLPPEGDWTTAAWVGGRGSGKTRPCVELFVRAGLYPQCCAGRLAMIGRTAADVRDTMVYGESGLMAAAERLKINLVHKPSHRSIEWPSGTVATTYSADEPGQMRGPQHGGAWCDELAWWPHEGAEGRDPWQTAQDSIRLGPLPWTLISTTPRPTKRIRDLVTAPRTFLSNESMLANRDNLPAEYVQKMIDRYEGTTIGRQELHGEILMDGPDRLWTERTIDRNRHKVLPEGGLERIVIAVDPAATKTKHSDETGIIIAGKAGRHAWPIKDLSGKFSPDEWARTVAWAYREFKADRVVAEVNNGGDMVEAVLRTVDPSIPYRAVRATRGKWLRAEPVAALYEQGRVHHLGREFHRLEEQMTTWTPDVAWSPDRLDALVYAITDLLIDEDADTVSPIAYARLDDLYE